MQTMTRIGLHPTWRSCQIAAVSTPSATRQVRIQTSSFRLVAIQLVAMKAALAYWTNPWKLEAFLVGMPTLLAVCVTVDEANASLSPSGIGNSR